MTVAVMSRVWAGLTAACAPSDVERQLRLSTGELGLEGLRVEQWRRGEVGFPSVRIDAGTIIDLFGGERDGTNVDHFCLVVTDVDVDELVASARFPVLDGPVDRWGARGTGRSIYLNDPDGNVVELRTYPGSRPTAALSARPDMASRSDQPA